MKCDWLNLSVPDDSMATIRHHLLELVLACGAISVRKGAQQIELFKLGRASLRLEEKRGFHTIGVSGQMLSLMSEKGLWDSYLGMVSEVPHRVTRLDIAHDVAAYSPPILKRIFNKGSSSKGIHLTRKRARNVRMILSKPLGCSDPTGTVYLNKNTAEVYAKIYDKRQEQLDNRGCDIGLDITRYELSVTNKAGVSLSDAYSPDACFWHFMSDVLAPPTVAASPWEPGGYSFKIPALPVRLPSERLVDLVESSCDLEVLLGLASEIGPSGLEFMMRQIRARAYPAAYSFPDQPASSLQGS